MLSCFLPPPPPLQLCICWLCAQPANYSNISKEQTCSWPGIIKLWNAHVGTIHLPNVLLLTQMSWQRLFCMCSFANMAENKQHTAVVSTLQPTIFLRTVWSRIYSFSLICVHHSFMAWQEVISLGGELMSLNKNHHKRCIQAEMAFNRSSSMGPVGLIKHAPLVFLKFYSSSCLYGAILSSCLQLC